MTIRDATTVGVSKAIICPRCNGIRTRGLAQAMHISIDQRPVCAAPELHSQPETVGYVGRHYEGRTGDPRWVLAASAAIGWVISPWR